MRCSMLQGGWMDRDEVGGWVGGWVGGRTDLVFFLEINLHVFDHAKGVLFLPLLLLLLLFLFFRGGWVGGWEEGLEEFPAVMKRLLGDVGRSTGREVGG